ncbi:hypothetical protein HUJ05_006774 [Dendroctonus ponderosae]|nr:hypothetical protein HUJ05_006774 [Dendroctonus ponderosae]
MPDISHADACRHIFCIDSTCSFRPDHPDSWRFFNSDIIPAVGIMAFAFMCHHNTFLIYSSIADTSQKKWETVTHASILTSLIVSCIFGIAGYATFKAYCQEGTSYSDLGSNYVRGIPDRQSVSSAMV